jgi:hypothetical protein
VQKREPIPVQNNSRANKKGEDMRHYGIAAMLALLFVSVGFSGELVTTELLRDNHFETGFCVISPVHATRMVEGLLNFDGKTRPVWDLAQWFTKYSLCGAQPEFLADGAVKYKNEARYIIIGKPGTEYGDITLALDSRPEYKGVMRKKGQPWPHLLIEQPISKYIFLAEMKELHVHIEAKLLYDESFELEGYNSEMHAAGISYVLVVQNCNKTSKGCGDFLWFLVPVYNTRFKGDTPEYIAADTIDPSVKMIYKPSSKAYGDYNLHDKKWHTIDADILPLMKESIKVARQKGYLKDSDDLRDYTITSMNFGWEHFGTNNVAIQIRNLSLKAVTSVDNCAKAGADSGTK